MSNYHGNALVTVEGFADNGRFGRLQQEAGHEACRRGAQLPGVRCRHESADQVRAVSYGEASNRQVEPGKSHAEGAENRRATLVIDFPGGTDAS